MVLWTSSLQSPGNPSGPSLKATTTRQKEELREAEQTWTLPRPQEIYTTIRCRQRETEERWCMFLLLRKRTHGQCLPHQGQREMNRHQGQKRRSPHHYSCLLYTSP